MIFLVVRLYRPEGAQISAKVSKSTVPVQVTLAVAISDFPVAPPQPFLYLLKIRVDRLANTVPANFSSGET